VLRLVLEPAQLLGFVWGGLGADQSRSQPIDLFLFVVLIRNRPIRSLLVHRGFLDYAHDGLLGRRFGDIVSAAVPHNQQRLVRQVVDSRRHQIYVGHQLQRARLPHSRSPHLDQQNTEGTARSLRLITDVP
jgi:hypothetical protein